MPTDPKHIRALRQKAEKALLEAPEKPALMSGTDLQGLVHELSVHQIELEMQNEELRRSQEQLEESRTEYADLYDFAPVGYLTFDAKGLISRANLTACGLLGIERSLLLKKPFAIFIHPESRDLFHFHRQKVVEITTTQACQLVLKRKDGTFFDARLESVAVQFHGNALIRTVLTDITEHKRADQALRRQADLLELAHCAILVRDLESRITFWNARAEALYGWAKAEAIGNVTDTLLKTRFPVPFDEYMAALTKEGRWEGDLVHRTKAGRQITVLSRQALEKDAAGKPLAILEINLDITEARRMEAQLRQAHKMEALGTLAGGIAHDFNNILAAIIGFSEMARDKTPEGSPARLHMERVFGAGVRGRELVKRILAFSRQAEQQKHPLKIARVVKETLKLLRASLPSTIHIRTNLRSEAGFVLADPTQMQEVIMNLCTNGAYAMREKGGTLEIELSDHRVPPSNGSGGMKPGLYSKLVVRDSGAGIPADIVDRIFDPFFTTKEQAEGTGLGLSVVHGIVKQHDGHITVESEPGSGSTFTVYLPKITEQPEVKTVGEASIPTGRERILFIDDEGDLVEMGTEMLTDLGYFVTSKTGAREALALFRLDPSRFDLVITDQTMPEMTGTDLAKEILAIRGDMPIIMCTGFSYAVDADKAKAAGIKAFAMKPLTKGEIAKTIRKVLDG
jgi:PAS domain S-box-containing protein